MNSILKKSYNGSFLKFIYLLLTLATILSNPLITVYTQNDRYIQESLKDLISSVKSLKTETLDLSQNEINFDKIDKFTNMKGKVFNFLAEEPVLTPFEINGTIANRTIIFNNNDKENAFQFDLSFNYSISMNQTLYNGMGNVRYVSSLFMFKKGFIENRTDYSIIPDLKIQFKYFDTNLLNIKDEQLPLQTFLDKELRVDEKIKNISENIASFIDKNVEQYFIDKINQKYEVKLTNKPLTNFSLSITPILLPDIIKNGTQGLQSYLDGRLFNTDGSLIIGIDYAISQTPIFKNEFDYTMNSPKQIFISYRVFADMIKVDLMKIGSLPIYENQVDLSNIPFRFNVMYLSKFIPGLNQLYSNTQKFFVEIKIKDVVFKYGENINEENPQIESFVIIDADIFFKTSEVQAGQIILEFSLQTKSFLEVYRPLDSNKLNIKFRQNIEILECIPKAFKGYNIDLDNFVDEFEKSYSLTNIGAFDYNLFANPISLNDLIGENYDIIKTNKGVLLVEMLPPTPPLNKTLEFLK